MRRTAYLAGLLVCAGLAAGCGDDTPTTPTLPSPSTNEFSSQLVIKGATSRSFSATKTGVVTVTLQEAGPPGTRVGLGIGVPFSTTVAGCALSKSITATAGGEPQLVEGVDAGRYCVAIFDNGTLTAPISFKMTIVFP
jgi:hypothetical protein